MIITKNIGVYCEKNNFKKLEKYLEQENFQVEKTKGRIKYNIQLDNYVFNITVAEITGCTRISSLSRAKVVSGYDEIKSFCDSFIRSEEKEALPNINEVQEGGVLVGHSDVGEVLTARQVQGHAYEAQMNNYRELREQAHSEPEVDEETGEALPPF